VKPAALLLALLFCVHAAEAKRPASRKAADRKPAAAVLPGKPDMSKPPVLGPAPSYRPPKRERFTLSNGLAVLFARDARSPLVSARLVVRGGAALAGRRDAGIVDAMAELLSAGTSVHSAREISFEADAFGGALSASAHKDYVELSAYALSDRAARMFALLAEAARDPSFPPEEVELRRKNMLSELKVERSQPAFLASVAFFKQLYGRHPYAVVAPTEDSIARIDREKLQAFHRSLFTPGNALLVVVGDVERAPLEAELERAFASWAPVVEAARPPLPAPQEGPLRARRVALVDRPGSAQSMLMLGNLAVPDSHPDHYKLLVANQVLGGSFASRLMSDLREKRGYTYGIYSSLHSARSAGAFVVRTQVRGEVTGDALKAVLEHVERLRREPVTAQELEQAKNTLIGGFVRGFETQAGLADALAQDWALDLPEDRLDAYVQRIEAVTAEDALAAAKAYLHPDRLLLTVVGDGQGILPALSALSPSTVLRLDENGEESSPVRAAPPAPPLGVIGPKDP
jgi:zinc protease